MSDSHLDDAMKSTEDERKANEEYRSWATNRIADLNQEVGTLRIAMKAAERERDAAKKALAGLEEHLQYRKQKSTLIREPGMKVKILPSSQTILGEGAGACVLGTIDIVNITRAGASYLVSYWLDGLAYTVTLRDDEMEDADVVPSNSDNSQGGAGHVRTQVFGRS